MRPSALELSEAREVASAATKLARVPAGGDPMQVFNAIPSRVGIEAGLLGVFEAGAPHALRNRPLGLPHEILQGWLATSPEHFASALAVVENAAEGAFWSDTDKVLETSRAGLAVLDHLAAHGLGGGAGYKVMEHRTPGRGTDYTFLALLTQRGTPFPSRAPVLLAELHASVRAAICRLSLPLVPTTPILRQIVDDDEQGYVCLSTNGTVIEVNRRAYEIAVRYQRELGLHHRSRLLGDLAARRSAAPGNAFQALREDGREVLEIRLHHLVKETHTLSEDVTLLVLRTVEIPAAAFLLGDEPTFPGLTRMERRIAKLLVSTGDSRKEIASNEGVSEGTIRTHMQNIYRKLGVQSRAELTAMGRSQPR